MNFLIFCFLDTVSASFGVKCLFIHYSHSTIKLLKIDEKKFRESKNRKHNFVDDRIDGLVRLIIHVENALSERNIYTQRRSCASQNLL